MQHLGLGAPVSSGYTPPVGTLFDPPGVDHPSSRRGRIVDIRSLKDQKKPATDVEMATLVAYYLKHEVSGEEHKDETGTEDIEKYFVQAGYPLPANKHYTLPNAKKSRVRAASAPPHYACAARHSSACRRSTAALDDTGRPASFLM